MKLKIVAAVAAIGLAAYAKAPAIGYMLDISRDKVPTMASLRRMVDVLSALGYNQFQLYTEHTFAYKAHATVWADASPMTAGEIRELDAYCRDRGIELVPNQNSFGHLEKWFKHPEYRPLAEAPYGGVKTAWNSSLTATLGSTARRPFLRMPMPPIACAGRFGHCGMNNEQPKRSCIAAACIVV